MAIKLSWKKALVHYLYGTIATVVDRLVANFGIALNRDVVIAALGYFLVSRWDAEVGEALFYGAIQSIGQSGGFSLAGLFGGQAQTQQKSASTATTATTSAYEVL